MSDTMENKTVDQTPSQTALTGRMTGFFCFVRAAPAKG
jgi:hypothetical protein